MRQLIEHHGLQLNREDIHQGQLILVNRDHPVRLLIEQQSLETTCARQLSALLHACDAKDDIVVVSGYRSIEEQQSIYDRTLMEHGMEYTSSYVARPGESEHQTGLAIDVGEKSANIDFICPSFPDHGVYYHFKQLAAQYGFIQRYQEGKENFTSIACEPWHYRYVGYPHSVMMEQQGLCLEEYTEYVKQYTYQIPYRYIKNKASIIEIYYVPAQVHTTTTVPIMTSEPYHWSGNNKDGFVVTVFHNQGSESNES